MRVIFTILFLYSLSANATNYYFANSGDNSNLGTINSPFQTLVKFSSYFSSVSPGDSLLFKRGDTFYTTTSISLSRSGSLGSPIIIGAYGVGVKPVLTALQALSGFTNVGNIWSATASASVSYQNTVLINGVVMAKGRYPNSTTISYNTFPDSSSYRIKSASLSGQNYVGGQVVQRQYGYIWDVGNIYYHNLDTIKFAPLLAYPAYGGNYFIQNIVSVLDVQNEWCIDGSKLLSIYSTSQPTDVKYSTVDTLFNVYKKDHIVFSNLDIQGANNVAIYLDSVSRDTVKNCNIKFTGGNNLGASYVGGVGGAAIMCRTTAYVQIKSDSITNSLNDGILCLYASSDMDIEDNYLYNIGHIVGMAAGSNGASIGIFVTGHKPIIKRNVIRNIGYNGVHFIQSDTTLVENNWVDTCGLNKNDGGAFYTVFTGSEGSRIINNIATSCGLTQLANSTVAGIYLDGNSSGITVTGNTVYKANAQGVLFHYPDHISFKDNIIIDSIGYPFYYATGGSGNNLDIKRNIFYSQSSTQYCIYSAYSTLPTTSFDSNFYLRPINEVGKLRIGATEYYLPQWTAATGWDAHGKTVVNNLTSIYPLILLNPTTSDSTVSFTGMYRSATGEVYINSAVIPPFASKILFPTTNLSGRIGNLIFTR